MADYLNSLLGIDIPVWAYIAAPVVIILLTLFVLWFVHTRVFKSRLRRIIKAQDDIQMNDAILKFEKHYPANKLIHYSKRMERYSRQMGPRVVQETGLAEKWVKKLATSALPTKKDLRRVLLYCPTSYLFKAFVATTQHPRLQKSFKNWMQNEGEEKTIRLLAETCRGEDFNPAFGKIFLENNGNLFRELTSEPEWYARYFAYKILLLDKETLTERSLEAGLLDPHPLVRKIISENIEFEREKTWTVLWDKLIHDPVFEVREAARKRIAKEFMDIYSPKSVTLNDDETARILELLDPACQEDRTFAMSSLESTNKMLRYPAATFMEKCGVLSTILANNTLDDPVTIEHSVSILQKALEVNVAGFLKDYPTGDGAPLLAAARLLAGSGGTQDTICYLEKKVFAFFSSRKPDPSTNEIYAKTLDAVINNESDKALGLFADELSRRENDRAFLKFLLPRISNKAEGLFTPILFRFLGNVEFPAREELVYKLGTFSPDIILPKVYQILNGSRAEYPHAIRISALKILGLLRLPFCLQRIMESLPTLTSEEFDEFARLLADYPQDIFEEKARGLLASPDARIRASLISVFPTTKNETFLKEIRTALKDVDPDVRVAAIKALLGFGEIKLLNQETSMLRDPVERVRLTTAEVIARHGNAAAMEILKNITTDANETDVVKTGVIMGLGQASDTDSIKILVGVLDTLDEFRTHAEKALSMRVTKRDITQLIEIFKDAEPPLREKLIPVFKIQGRKAEPQILEILKDEVTSFKPYLVKILEETGYVDEAKRRLSDRNVEERRDAAILLSLMDTLPAFRGLVLAAKDPDQEVRVCVVKALEKLKSSHSRDTLEKLKEDPDSRIRKYTFWALERLDSLAME
jgi:HEAT repeat protein